jgi:NTP pyrophosphatase (non-canonical NTP hydrolase)
MTMTEKRKKVINWANERNLIHEENAKTQFIKLVEEVGEMGKSLLKNNKEQLKDDFGDVQIVLIILAEQLGIDLDECLELAYNEIKDRKGKMIGGSFVKQSDL